MINKDKKSIGIDIADNSVEIVELYKNNGKIEILKLKRINLELGIVESGRIKNIEKLVQIVKKILLEIGIKKGNERVFFSLPESQVYTKILEINVFNNKGLKNVIQKEARTLIPISEDDLFYTYKVLDDFNDKNKVVTVLLIATSKKVIFEWQEFFNKIQLYH